MVTFFVGEYLLTFMGEFDDNLFLAAFIDIFMFTSFFSNIFFEIIDSTQFC